MKKRAALLAVLSLPVPAYAADGFDLAGSVVQTFASLALVVGIILLVYWLAGRVLKGPQGGGGRGYIRVVETRHLAPKKSLMLVEVAGEYLLLSNCADGVSFLKKVEMLEEIEVVEEQRFATLIPARVKERLTTLAADLPLALAKRNGGVA